MKGLSFSYTLVILLFFTGIDLSLPDCSAQVFQSIETLPDTEPTASLPSHHFICNHAHSEDHLRILNENSNVTSFENALLPQQTHLVLGGRSVLIVRGVDPATDTWSDTDANLADLHTELDTFVRKTSFNRAWISSFDMTPVYNFTVDPDNPEYWVMSQTLKAMAENEGYNVDAYNVVFYIHQSTTTMGGAGALGSGNGLNGTVWAHNNLAYYHPGNIHETFHAFGVGHAETIEGGDNSYPGSVTGGHDPYHFMGSQWDAELDSDVPSYFKYRFGWIDPSEVLYLPDAPAACETYRIHKTLLVPNYNAQNKYAIQLGQNMWIGYEPDNYNSNITKKGLLLHHIPFSGAGVTRILDTRPNSITTLPDGVSSNFLPVIDFWDAAMELGDSFIWEGTTIEIVATGGAGDEKWADVQLCNCITISGDSDNDSVCDARDVCPGGDDTIDTDFDNIPDQCDDCPNDPANDSNGDNICDDLQCLNEAFENFDYDIGTIIDNANGGTGFNGTWTKTSTSSATAIASFTAGSLTETLYPDVGNKLRLELLDESQNLSVKRNLDKGFATGQEMWLSVLVRAENVGTGGFWIRPDVAQASAIGKRWGSNFSIDNNDSGISMVAGQTYWLVAKYELQPAETIVKLWINPDFATLETESNPDATKTTAALGDVTTVDIAVATTGAGDYEIDALHFFCEAPTDCPGEVTDHFDYGSTTLVDDANGGSGFASPWQKISPDVTSAKASFASGSLLGGVDAVGNKLKLDLLDETEGITIERSIDKIFPVGRSFWVSAMVRAENIANGGFWIRPNNNQVVAIGKSWGTHLSVDNNNSTIGMVEGQAYWIVAQYELQATETVVKLWVDPNLDELQTATNPDATKTTSSIGSVTSIAISVAPSGAGDYEVDALELLCEAPIRCPGEVMEQFEYDTATVVDNANGGTGFLGPWQKTSAGSASASFVAGSLSGMMTPSVGNKLRLDLLDETESLVLERNLGKGYPVGHDLWVSAMVRAENIANGGFWIRPNNEQVSAIGKSWGTRLSIDNNNSAINMVEGQAYWLVAKYELGEAETVVKLWIDPDLTELQSEANPDATKTTSSIGNVTSIAIAVAPSGAGDYEVDALRLLCEAPTRSCLYDLVLRDAPITDGTYAVDNNLISDGEVDLGTNVIFKAGNNITLERGFTVHPNSNFEALIEGCGQ